MQQIDLNNWAEFKPVIEDIRNKYGYHEYSYGANQVYKGKNTVLFRGQHSSEWPIETTLERRTKKQFTISSYLLRSTKFVHELESFTGIRWELEDTDGILREKEEKQGKPFRPYLPRIDYLLHLRHHGYPSPFLDWSGSPYIAAYFAMSETSRVHDPNARVAIYAYIDSTEMGKSFEGTAPFIQVIGPYISTHKRHFTQKAQYTFATQWSETLRDFVFCSHNEIFNNPNKDFEQDILIKITIPIKDKKTALQELGDYNINHFTLFQSEDSLVQKFGIEDFEINDTF